MGQDGPGDLPGLGHPLDTARLVLRPGPLPGRHCGAALQALKGAETEVYLGPLRLLALEVFDTLNGQGTPCSLLTGEEREDVPGSGLTASTVEMCDYAARYDLAVIDECQMLGDRARGGQWLKAILTVNAREVHLCAAPEAEPLLRALLGRLDAPCRIERHRRLAGLEWAGCPGQRPLRGPAAPGAPGGGTPVPRRGDQGGGSHRRHWHGVSLPIRRIIFCQTEKFDGAVRRDLTVTEVLQIAGRAGRYGMYDKGYVLSMDTKHADVRKALHADPKPVKKAFLPFPEEALEAPCALEDLFQAWHSLPGDALYRRQDMEEPRTLLESLRLALPETREVPNRKIYSYVTCPVSSEDHMLRGFWIACCQALLCGESLPRPDFGEESLGECERQYRGLDVLHQMGRRAGVELDLSREKQLVCNRINELLRASKEGFLRRCSSCGKPLPPTSEYGMCEECYQSRFRTFRWYDEDDEEEDEDRPRDRRKLAELVCDYSLENGTWEIPAPPEPRPREPYPEVPADLDHFDAWVAARKEQFEADLDWYLRLCARPLFLDLLESFAEVIRKGVPLYRSVGSFGWHDLRLTGESLDLETDTWRDFLVAYTGNNWYNYDFETFQGNLADVLRTCGYEAADDVLTAYRARYGDRFLPGKKLGIWKGKVREEVLDVDMQNELLMDDQYPDMVLADLLPMYNQNMTMKDILALADRWSGESVQEPVFTFRDQEEDAHF